MAALICLGVFLIEPACTVLFRIVLAMYQALAGILRPATSPHAQHGQRITSCLLLGSLACLGVGMAVWSTGRYVLGSELLWLAGALGLLVSGLLGSHLEPGADSERQAP